jgi:hypothetical protein
MATLSRQLHVSRYAAGGRRQRRIPVTKRFWYGAAGDRRAYRVTWRDTSAYVSELKMNMKIPNADYAVARQPMLSCCPAGTADSAISVFGVLFS